MKRFATALLALYCCLPAAGQCADKAPRSAAEMPIETFVQPPEFLEIHISPKGDYLAASVLLEEDRGALAILRRSDMKLMGTFKLAGRDFVDDFVWANNQRVLLSIAESDGSRDTPSAMGEVFGVNFDGSDARMLAGGRRMGTRGRSMVRKDAHLEWIFVIDALRTDDDHVLIYVFPQGGKQGSYPRIERMDIHKGTREVLARAPILNADFLVDEQQRVRFAWGLDENFEHRLFYRENNAAEWAAVAAAGASKGRQYAVGMSPDGALAYLQVEQASGPDELVSWNPKTNERQPLIRNPIVDPSGLFYSTDHTRLLGVYFSNGRPSIDLLDGKHADAVALRVLMQSFPGEWVRIESATEDGSLLVFSVSSDRNPGEFYLHDRVSGKNTFLMARRKWINPDLMAEMKPIEFKARDGQTLYGYLTVPVGSDGKLLPLILNPHGGPIAISDHWGFSDEVQLLASRGYAVLQVNFRGSDNYGRSFLEQGYRQWGGLMIDDQTDAVRWAIAQGIADSKRVCIYGASYGAYAALMGAAREPDLYRCAVGYVGVYDMPKMFKDDSAETRRGRRFLEKTLGDDPQFLASISPTNLADKIKVPVFLAAGGLDGVAPKEHSESLRRALKRAGNAPQWLLADHEGHGFYRLEENLKYYNKLLAFFDRYIGAGRAPD